MEDINSLLKYNDDDFTPTGNLCYINQNGEKLHRKFMKEFFNLRWFIQHLIDKNEYEYNGDQWTNPLSESNWIYQINRTFMKYVNFTLKEMTPEQMKMNPIKPIIKLIPIKNLIQRKGSLPKFTSEEEEEYSTFSHMSKHDSEFDINVDDTQDEQNTQTPETLQNNTTMHDKHDVIHDEYDTSGDGNKTEIETYEDFGEKIDEIEESISTETSQVVTVFNKAIHHEDDSSDDKSVIEIEPPKENGEREIGKQDKLLTTAFQMEIENRKVEGLITYSTDQQIFKLKLNSGNNQELWGVNIQFTFYELKCTIHAILQHMGFIIQQRIHVSR